MATPQMISGVHIADIKYEIDVDLDKAISNLQKLKTSHTREGWTNLRLDIDAQSDYGDSYYAHVNLIGDRMETAEEAIIREGTERQRAKFIEDRERDQYEQLRKKFGP